jgi:hypothetical protein
VESRARRSHNPMELTLMVTIVPMRSETFYGKQASEEIEEDELEEGASVACHARLSLFWGCGIV